MNAAKVSLIWMPVLALALAGCGADKTPQPSPTPTKSVAAAPVATPIASASPQSCAEVPRNGRDFPEHPLTIPRDFASFVTGGETRLGVGTLAGKVKCIDLHGIAQTSRFAVTKDGRFLTFGWSGYEADGYKVVDRAGAGQVIETGSAPMFSPTRDHFIAAQMSEAAFGGLEGIGVWEVSPDKTRRIVTIEDEAPRGTDWRVVRWEGEDCAVLSMLPLDAEGNQRAFLQLRILPRSWSLERIPVGTKGCGTR